MKMSIWGYPLIGTKYILLLCSFSYMSRLPFYSCVESSCMATLLHKNGMCGPRRLDYHPPHFTEVLMQAQECEQVMY